MEEIIPFNRPCLTGNELRYISDSVSNGHTSAKGPFTQQVQELLQSQLSAPAVLLTTSCTDALEMTAMLLDIREGDVVIVPSFTFSSTATAFARQGAKIRFCDIRLPELGLDPDHVEASIDERVKAIVTVHYAGVGSQVERLRSLATKNGISLIEDNAHGLFATHNGKPLGTFGRFAALSFHETKNFICGEGGALVLNSDADIDRAHILLDKGTNRKLFLEGQTDKYTWQGQGSSFGMSDILAAFLLAQLESAEDIIRARRKVHETYRRLLDPLAQKFGLLLPFQPEADVPADHMFYVLLPESSNRSEVISSMKLDGINPTFHYVPLHSSPGAKLLADRIESCPVTDDVSARILRLPFFNEISETQQRRVVESLRSALHRD